MDRDLNLNTVTLWAMWYTKYGPTTMQGWKGCDQLQQHQVITLTDARDNNQYTVSKLKDGKCWMTQNLRIIDIEITNEDSNTNGRYVIPQHSTSFDASQSGIDKAATYKSGDTVYYSWGTATAGSGSQYTSSYSNAPYSICPKTFRLPTKKEYEDLLNIYGSNNLPLSPVNLNVTGEVCPTLVNTSSRYVFEWTSTKGSSSNNIYRFFTTGVQDCGCGGRGLPMRCINN